MVETLVAQKRISVFEFNTNIKRKKTLKLQPDLSVLSEEKQYICIINVVSTEVNYSWD